MGTAIGSLVYIRADPTHNDPDGGRPVYGLSWEKYAGPWSITLNGIQVTKTGRADAGLTHTTTYFSLNEKLPP